jgi:hypothetical protein
VLKNTSNNNLPNLGFGSKTKTISKKQHPTILNIARPIIAIPKITLPSPHQVEDFFGDAAAWGVVGIGLTGEVLRRAVFGN